jgi:hypothetical protein
VSAPSADRTGRRAIFRLERPVPPTPAGVWLRRLIGVTAAAVILVEAMNLLAADEPGFSLLVRTAWALLRVVGFLVLMRAVRYGRAGARPFGLILAVTTAFAVFRLTEPRQGGLLPGSAILVGWGILALLCAAVVVLLYRSDAVAAHLATRPVRRHVPGWVLTARVAVLAYGALVLVPLLDGVGVLFSDERRQPLPQTAALLILWTMLFVLVAVVLPLGSFFVLMGKTWARWLLGTVTVVVLVFQPWLCYAVLGFDSLLRDGVPLVLTAVVALLALHRARGADTWVRAQA